MLRRTVLPAAILALGLTLAAHAQAAAEALPAALPDGAPNTPVPALDLDRYTGRWHEVARLPTTAMLADPLTKHFGIHDATPLKDLLREGKVYNGGRASE